MKVESERILTSIVEEGLSYGKGSAPYFISLLILHGAFDTQERKYSVEQQETVKSGKDFRVLTEQLTRSFTQAAFASTSWLYHNGTAEIQKKMREKFKAIMSVDTPQDMPGILNGWRGIYKCFKLWTQVLFVRDPNQERRDVQDNLAFQDPALKAHLLAIFEILGMIGSLPKAESGPANQVDQLLFLGANETTFLEFRLVEGVEYIENRGTQFDRWACLGGDRDLWVGVESYLETYLALHSNKTKEEVREQIRKVSQEIQGSGNEQRKAQKTAVQAGLGISQWPSEYDMVEYHTGQLCIYRPSWQQKAHAAIKGVGHGSNRATTADTFEAYVEHALSHKWLEKGQTINAGVVSNQPHGPYQYAVAQTCLRGLGEKYGITFNITVYAKGLENAGSIAVGVFTDNIGRQIFVSEPLIEKVMSL